MSFTRTAKAVVVSCSLAASEQITVDLTVTLYQVQARVRESQYGDDVYMVRVVKPEGIGDLIDEEGTLMEHGRFSFDLTEEIAIDTELEVEITGIGSSQTFAKGTRAYPKARCERLMSQGTNPAWGVQGCVSTHPGADGRKWPCVINVETLSVPLDWNFGRSILRSGFSSPVRLSTADDAETISNCAFCRLGQ
jgi:hypothetical protein